jgi:DNA-directed RNA polymerase subunit RPC12/RpoP/uncharacterized protein (DUF1778 family)
MAGADDDGEREDAPEPSTADGGVPTPVLPYASARRDGLKTLRRMPAFEANLAAAKLGAAGIPAFVADENMSAAHPVLHGQVRLQVEEDNLEAAEAVLDTPAAPASAGTGDEDDYVEEEYRCPKCHRKAVDLLPPSPRMRSTRLGCLGVLVLPVVLTLLANLSTDDDKGLVFPPLVTVAWLAVLAVLAFVVITAKRRKRCRECGHEW